MGWRSERSFTTSVETPGSGRTFVVDAMNRRVPPNVCGDVELMVSELITNSLRAGARTITVALAGDDEAIRLEVSDDGGGMPTVRDPTDQDTSGRGLRIVDALADRWAIDVDAGRRTTVWAEISLKAA